MTATMTASMTPSATACAPPRRYPLKNRKRRHAGEHRISGGWRGAGAADGIAAARRLATAGRRFCPLSRRWAMASADAASPTPPYSGLRFDRSAQPGSMPDIVPVAKLGAQTKIDVCATPPSRGRAHRAAGRQAKARWRTIWAERCALGPPSRTRRAGTISPARRRCPRTSAAGPIDRIRAWPVRLRQGSGRGLAPADFAHSAERDNDVLCRQGFGALLAKLATGLPVELSNPVSRMPAGRAPGASS